MFAMKFAIFHLLALAGSMGHIMLAQSPEGSPVDNERSKQDSGRITRELESNIEKTTAIFNIADDALYSDTEKLSITRPKYIPGTGIGIGASLAECVVTQKTYDTKRHKRFEVQIFGNGLMLVTEIITEDFTSHHRFLGWFESKEIWNKLRLEVMRQSRNIKINRMNKQKRGCPTDR